MLARMICMSLLLNLLLSATAIAAGGTSWGRVSQINVNAGWTMVRVSGISENPDSSASVEYYAIESGDAGYDTFHATMLAAMVADKEIRFWVSGCGGQSASYPHITSIWVNQDGA